MAFVAFVAFVAITVAASIAVSGPADPGGYNNGMHPNEIRASFLKYFERQGHRIVPSSPLVPADDPTLLFTNAGMNQFKDLFLGRERRSYTRATTAQKVMRVSGKHNDLDAVGPSFRHHTFFEMLGNFSFGDYFKAQAIPFAWELLTDVWKLDPSRLHATVFRGEPGIPRDDEAYELWRRVLPDDHVGELGAGDNFWAMGDTGPCGRCSEIYYDRGPSVPGTGKLVVDVEAGSDRFVEIWNNVFMEFDRQADGTLVPLPAPSIDTGMGLERMSAVMKGVLSTYDTELFTPVLTAIGALTGTTHRGTMDPQDVSMRVIADHIRASTFLIADGVVPSNEWRGYVLRKIMRRAMRHGHKLGLDEPFLHSLVDVLVREMGDAYPELRRGRDAIVQVIRSEEERFDVVLTAGLPRLEQVLEDAARGDGVVSGEQAFRLYDTFGLPRDFIEDLTANQGLRFDTEGFERAMEAQRQRARAGGTFEVKSEAFSFASDETRDVLRQNSDPFEGYTSTSVKGVPVIALFDRDRHEVDELPKGASGYVVLAKTPFYLEAGGQVSDQGRLVLQDGTGVRVTSVVRLGPGLPRAHRVADIEAPVRVRDLVSAEIDAELRAATRRNHTATHLLHAALRTVLGPHVKQAGSLVAPDRLRFDFVHFSPVTPEQRREIEGLVNREILRNTVVNTVVRNTQEAIAAGAMALFGEKYGDQVRVVSIGDGSFSVELCGGTHVSATGDIGVFLLTDESGVAAGVRRIEALTGAGALAFARERIDLLDSALRSLNVKPQELVGALETQTSSVAKLRKEVQQLKTRLALGAGTTPRGEAEEPGRQDIHGIPVIARAVADVDKDSLRSLADALKSKLKSGIVFLAAPMPDGKVVIIASVTPDLIKRAPAGQLVRQLAPIVGGGGGGRPDFAEAGGKHPEKIEEMLAESRKLLHSLLAPS